MQPDFKATHFALLGLPEQFAIDMVALERAWHQLQASVHPDRFAHLGDAEKRASMQWSSRVNEAWQTLRKPLDRAAYLLSLRGIDALAPSQTSMAPMFLMQQMEWREALDNARGQRNSHELQRLEQEIRQSSATWLAQLERQLDQDHDDAAAATTLRQLKFVEKLRAEIDNAWIELES